MKYIFAILFFSVITVNAQTFDSRIQTGITQIYNIKFDAAEKTFRELIADYPKHPAGRFFLAMVDWWKIMIDLDNTSYDDLFFQKLEDVIFQCDQILENDPNNIDALFFKGGAIGFRGRLRANRKSYLKAVDDGKIAYSIVEKAAKLDPANSDVQLGFGIYNYYAAVLPEKEPIIKPLMVFFPKGDKQKGLQQLNDASEKGKYSNYEAAYFLMTSYYNYENDPYAAEKYATILNEKFPDNPSFQRWAGRIAARKGDVEKAGKIFKDVFDKSETKFPGYTSDKIKREATYYVGLQYKNINNADSAIFYFNKCIDLSRKIDQNNSGFIANALLYAGMMYDAKGDRNTAIKYYNETLEAKEFSGTHSLAKLYLEKPFKL